MAKLYILHFEIDRKWAIKVGTLHIRMDFLDP